MPFPSTEPRSKHFSIRLPRPLWILLSAMALTAGWLVASIGIPAYRQQQAIRELNDAGALIIGEFPGPRWLVAWMYGHHVNGFAKVEMVYMDRVTDRHLRLIRNFESLTSLYILNGQAATDGGLAHIENLKELRTLWLVDSNTSDSQLARLSRLTHLRDLTIRGSTLSDSALSQLDALADLRHVDLICPGMTAQGIDRFRRGHPAAQINLVQDDDFGLELPSIRGVGRRLR